ncbi:MAG: hypothetical protein ONB07_08075, partial [candidate division KSB1 bacterium]|nr:hypothetical protein [candidate division KSB1 bacterium]
MAARLPLRRQCAESVASHPSMAVVSEIDPAERSGGDWHERVPLLTAVRGAKDSTFCASQKARFFAHEDHVIAGGCKGEQVRYPRLPAIGGSKQGRSLPSMQSSGESAKCNPTFTAVNKEKRG